MNREHDLEAEMPVGQRVAQGEQYGDDVGADDVDPSTIHGVAPPCDRCGEQEAVETIRGDRDMCDECSTIVQERERFLDWLTPTRRRDYVAVVVEGQRQADRAQERGVTQPVVSINVSEARERLQEIAEQEGDL